MDVKECKCGSDVVYIDPRHGWVVFCHDCDVETSGMHATAEEAIAAWNRGEAE